MADETLRPTALSNSAAAIARSYGADACVIITMGKTNTRIGAAGFSARGLREALCLGINYSIECPEDFEELKADAPDKPTAA